ncbi:MAG: LytTR family transcriptional regulator DNA-binding domain-containing protein [Bacteroidaceae bacterium]|jgi:DNA-binding LytR/AlgR family response regulator|nr:LytTR family transcriptional regulator DNA-binding domain-containing protein [Bacteroidaceae bacterium]
MEWLKIKTSTELVRVSTDEIVYVCADGNYSDLVLTNGRTRKMTFQLHFFEDVFKQLNNNTFVRVGRSVIVNKRYVFVINLTDQTLMFTGQQLSNEIKTLRLPREALKQLMEQLAEEKGGANGER